MGALVKYWLDLFTPYTWTRFQEHGATVSGFRPRQRIAAFERVKRGDLFLCYLVKLSRWCGFLEVSSDAFESDSPIFSDTNDPFPIRFKVDAKVMLDFEEAVPIEQPELWHELSFTKSLTAGARGWAQAAKLRQSLIEISATDAGLICRVLTRQLREKQHYPLDANDLRHIRNRTIVRTEKGEVEVEVPERDEEAASETALPKLELRASLAIQAKIAKSRCCVWF